MASYLYKYVPGSHKGELNPVPVKLKNLGWLLRHAADATGFQVTLERDRFNIPSGRCDLTALCRQGEFRATFEDYRVLYTWLDRPRFRGQPITIWGPLGQVNLTVGDKDYQTLGGLR